MEAPPPALLASHSVSLWVAVASAPSSQRGTIHCGFGAYAAGVAEPWPGSPPTNGSQEASHSCRASSTATGGLGSACARLAPDQEFRRRRPRSGTSNLRRSRRRRAPTPAHRYRPGRPRRASRRPNCLHTVQPTTLPPGHAHNHSTPPRASRHRRRHHRANSLGASEHHVGRDDLAVSAVKSSPPDPVSLRRCNATTAAERRRADEQPCDVDRHQD